MRKLENFVRDEVGGVDVSPLIDMVFILLIFFIVTTSFIEEKGLKAEAVENTEAIFKTDKPLIVSIRNNGEVMFEDRAISIGSLETVLSTAIQFTNSSMIVEIEDEVNAELMVAVMDTAKNVGVEGASLKNI